MKLLNLPYDELSKIVNESYGINVSVRQVMHETDLPFDVVYEMVGHKDWMDFYEDEEGSH